MAIDRYRKPTESVSEIRRNALLSRVMESQQVDLSQEIDEYERVTNGRFAQRERLPDWFAD